MEYIIDRDTQAGGKSWLSQLFILEESISMDMKVRDSEIHLRPGGNLHQFG